MVLLMHNGVFIGSCDVLAKGQVGLFTLGSWVMYSSDVKMVCVCVCVCVYPKLRNQLCTHICWHQVTRHSILQQHNRCGLTCCSW